jgi:hypothetical protein
MFVFLGILSCQRSPDVTQSMDIAADHPERVRELGELFWAEAERNHVPPLLGGRTDVLLRHGVTDLVSKRAREQLQPHLLHDVHGAGNDQQRDHE